MPFSNRITIPDDKIAPDLSNFNDENCRDAEAWVKKNQLPLIIANRSWDEIKDTYSLYKGRVLSKKLRINFACMRIYKRTMEQVYSLLKSKFQSDGKMSENDTIKMVKEEVSQGNDDMILQYILEESKKDVPPTNEYNLRKIMEKYTMKDVSITFENLSFTPDIIRKNTGTYCEEAISGFNYDKWLEAYEDTFNGYIVDDWPNLEKKRLSFLESIASMETLDRMKYNETLIRLGINPEVSMYSKITETPPVSIIDVSRYINYGIYDSVVNENKVNFNLFKPIFIVFKRTKESILNKAIAKFTKSFWAHAAISFDYTLKEMYTFDYRHGGFTKESIYSYPNGTIINVVGCFVSANIHAKMMSEIAAYKKMKKQTSYAFQNLIHCLTKKANEDTKAMVCSNFVDYMLKIGDISPTKMSWSIMTPGRLRKSIAHNKKKHFYDLYKGSIEDYNASKILLYLSKTSIKPVNEDKSTLEQETEKLYKELVEPFINLIPIEESEAFESSNDIQNLSKLTNPTTYI